MVSATYWENKSAFSMSRTMNAIKIKLSSRYMASFKSKINEETITKLITYTQFKASFKKEHYLSHSVDKRIVFAFSRLRASIHKLETESGRYKNIPLEELFCKLCNLNQVEDEYHFIMTCSICSESRDCIGFPNRLASWYCMLDYRTLFYNSQSILC